MTRQSTNEYRNGYVWNGFDYALQVWVLEGVIQPCGHPARMRSRDPCCNAHRLTGLRIDHVEGAEWRWCARCQTAAAAGCTLHIHALS